MLEIYLLIIGLLVPLGLAKHGQRRRRKFRRYIKGNVDEFIVPTGLAAESLLTKDFQDVVTETTWVSSIEASYSLRNWTPTINAGPLLMGYAHSDYSDTEIETFIEQSTNWDQSNLVAQEVTKRKIKIIGQMNPADAIAETSVFKEGRIVKTKLNWMLSTGATIQFWVYNVGGAAVASSSPNLSQHGTAHLWPR